MATCVSLNFFVTFNPAKSNVEIGKYNFRHFQSQGPGNFTSHQFSDQRFFTLACSAEF